jgi:hypothetical protein
LVDQWKTASDALIAHFYGDNYGVHPLPDIMDGLVHDGNEAMSRIYGLNKTHAHWIRVERGLRIRWFARFAEYVLEKET